MWTEADLEREADLDCGTVSYCGCDRLPLSVIQGIHSKGEHSTFGILEYDIGFSAGPSNQDLDRV